MRLRFNREKFFSGFRQAFGSMNQSQVDGLNFLLDKLESDTFTLPQAAYVLATVKWESANTFQPIKEKRGRVGSRIREIQDRYWNTGAYGRGYVQLTWPKNYEKFGMPDKGDYDLALKPEKAYEILAQGMREGMFTTHRLDAFINDKETDYIDARRVVNGVDRASDIAAIAQKFERILTVSLVADTQTVVEPPADPPKQDSAVEVKTDPPARVEVKQQGAGLTTKIAAGVSAITPILTATGLKIGGIELSTGALYALAAVVITGIIVGAILYDRGQQRGFEQTKLSAQNLADPAKQNVVIVK